MGDWCSVVTGAAQDKEGAQQRSVVDAAKKRKVGVGAPQLTPNFNISHQPQSSRTQSKLDTASINLSRSVPLATLLENTSQLALLLDL